MRRFERECQTLVDVSNHPNIVAAPAVGEESYGTLLDVTTGGTTMHAYELYYREGDVLSVIAFTRPEALTRAELTLVHQVASAQAQRVATLG